MKHPELYLNAKFYAKELKPIFKTINKSTVLPQLESVLISNNDGLTFQATDLETIVKIKFDTDIKEQFSFGLDGNTLKTFLNKSVDDILCLKFANEKCTLISDTFKLSCSTYSEGEFPVTPSLGEEALSFSIDVEGLNSHFTKALKFVSDDDLRPSMTGVSIKEVKGYIQIASTDAHKLYWAKLIKATPDLFGFNAIVPAKSVKVILETFKKGSVKVACDKKHITFTQDGKFVLARCIDATYPDYMSVLVNYDFSFCMIRKQLQSFLRLSDSFLNRATMQIKFIVDNDGITAKGGDADFDINLEYKVPIYHCSEIIRTPFEFAINSRFLQSILTMTKDEYVKINHSTSATKAMIIDECVLLMPLMIHD